VRPRFPIDGISYEAPAEDVFVGGWSRQASTGLVGYARKDGTNAARAVWQYLQTKQPVEPNLKAVTEKIKSLNKPVVTKDDIKKLEAVEIEEAKKRGIEEFKFDTNDDMLQAIGLTVTA
jgi:ferredoxin--NADP+ reductase